MNWINRGTLVLQGNIDKGVNMKKALAIFVTVCLLASLFVSCDNTTKLDELVSTRFDAAGSRSLIVSNENFIDINDSSIKWQYKAVKVSDPSYNVGAADRWTDIPGTPFGRLSNTIEFSQGKWDFELRAVKTNNDNSEVVIYYGKTEAPVLLQKQTSTDPQRIVINLTAQLDDQQGFIVLSGIGIKHNADDTSTFDVPDEVKIGTTVLTEGTHYTVSGNTISTAAAGLAFDVGTYTVTVKKTGENGEILAMEEKTVEVYAGLKTTISNWILEITQAGQFAPVAPTGTTSGNVSNADSAGNLALTVENVTPSMVSGKDTTVTVPTSVLGSSATTATVSVAVKQASEASTDNSFTASSGKVLAAVIDLTLSAGSNPVTDFSSSPVKVETYVAKNLADFTFGFPGETWTKKDSLNAVTVAKDYYYDSTEGKLTFLTDHFSSFIVETSSAAVIGDTAYGILDDAIDAALSNDVIYVLKDTYISLYKLNNKTVTLDLLGHTISNDTNEVFYSATIANGNSVIFKNGILEIDAKDEVYGTQGILCPQAGSSIELNNITMIANNGAALFPRGDAATVKVINSNIETNKAYCVSTNANNSENYNVKVYIKGSTLSGWSPVLVNIPCTLEIEDSTIKGEMHGLVVRGGTATIKDSQIINNGEADQDMLNFFNNRYWGSGNMVNLAALTFGNKGSSAYQYPTTVTVENTVIKSESYGQEKAYPAIYGYGNTGEGLGATLTYDEDCTITGDVILGNNAAFINGAAGPTN